MSQQRDIRIEEKPDGGLLIEIAGTVPVPVVTKVPVPKTRRR